MREVLPIGIYRAPYSTADGQNVLLAIGEAHPLTGRPVLLDWKIVPPDDATAERAAKKEMSGVLARRGVA